MIGLILFVLTAILVVFRQEASEIIEPLIWWLRK